MNGTDSFGGGGKGASQAAGGNGGAGTSNSGGSGTNGSKGNGGSGGVDSSASAISGGGGGGGGYYGDGGGGAFGGGGGGGSGYGPVGTMFQTGVRSGNGLITITYQGFATATVPASKTPTASNTSTSTQTATATATATATDTPTATTTATSTATATDTPTATATDTPTATSTATRTPTRTSTPLPVQSTLIASADSYVQKTDAKKNFGSKSTLIVDGTDDPREAYLRFSVNAAGTIRKAVLRLYVTDGTKDGPKLYQVANSTWSENTIIWNNRPGATGAVLGNLGKVNDKVWVKYDVTSVVTGNGTYSFVLVGDSTESIEFTSREGSNKPQLVLTVQP